MSSNISSVAETAVPAHLSHKTLDSRLSRLRKKSLRRQMLHYGLLAGNLAILIIVGLFIAKTSSASSSTHSGSATARMGSGIANAMAASNTVIDPLDQLSSADIAVNVARAANLPEVIPITNQADSENAQLSVSQSAGSLVTKPQVVSSTLKSSKDIHDYVVLPGESATSIAAKFGITTDSILWSNNLLTDSVSPGQTLVLPPVTGIVYIVKAGDTPDSLAQKFHADTKKIVGSNDAELTGLRVGSRILIPDGQIVKAVATVARSYGGSSSFPWGGGPVYGGANGYDYGYCTWYVASRIAVPSNWGNANTWDNLAPRSGWTVSTVPTIGAIAQTDRGAEGHVAIVTAVSPDGSQIKYSDMNGIAGWGREGFSGWTTVTRFEHYITR